MTALRPILLLILLCALILALLRYQQTSEEKNSISAVTPQENPEFYLEQALTTQYRQDGSVDYQFNSEHLDYFKNSDSAIGKTVYFIFFSKDGHTWHTRADQALFINGHKKIKLNGNVRVWQPARGLELTTDELIFNESKEYAETSKPVTIKSTVGITRSVGMKINLKEETLQLFSAVAGTYNVKK